MKLLKNLLLLTTLPLLGGCLEPEPSEAAAAGEQTPYTIQLPDGRIASGIGVRHGDTLLIGGDVVIPAHQPEQQRSQMGNAAYNLWPSKVIPYTFDAAVDAVTRQNVLSAMDPWRQAGFTFRQRTNEASFVRITTAYFPQFQWVCASTIGLQPNNTYYAGSACRRRDYVHEWGHIIGLFHEHCRNDRDQFVITNTCAPVGSGGYNMGAYDFGSIMHYDAYGRNADGSINFADVQIRPRDGRDLNSFGFNATPSSGDISTVRLIYWTEPPCGPGTGRICP